ncbi:CHAT domain-containing protein [Algoriphagus litoralis]|uniref:CHAT domain-containing protein n=1 Tax=Algoriphagus litoralis TaxID=2202829 RepID=UPI0018E53F03|nr:CHAT domain-containing protein [Algoriphagus litoralis]
MEESISDESIDLETRKKAFRLWAELTHFAKGHADITGKGPRFLQIFQNDPEYLSLEAGLDYYVYMAEASVSKIQNLEKLEAITRKLEEYPEDKGVYSLALDRLGRTYFDFNNYPLAMENLRKAAGNFTELDYKLILSNNLTVQGVVQDALENFSQSAKAYEASTQILEQLENEPYGTISANAYNLGLLYLDRLGDPERALPFFQKALENDRLDGGETNSYLGDDYKMMSLAALKMGDLSLAESKARRAVSHFEAINLQSSIQMATAKLQLALVLHYRKKPELAVEIVNEALLIIEQVSARQKSDLRRQQAQSYNQLGLHLIETEEWKAAEIAYMKALNLADELERDIFKVESLRGLIRLQLLNQNPEKALEYWRTLDRILLEKFQEAKILLSEQRLNYLKINFSSAGLSEEELIYALDILIKELASSTTTQELILDALQLKTTVLLQAERSGFESFKQIKSTLSQIRKIQNDKIGLINSIAINTSVRPLIEESLFLIHHELEKENQQIHVSEWNDLAFQLMEIQKRVIFETGRNRDYAYTENSKKHQSYLSAKQSLVEVQIKIAAIQQGSSQSKEKLSSLYASEDSLTAFVRSEAELFENENLTKTPVNSGVVRRQLDSGEMLAAYFVGAKHIFLWTGKESGDSFFLLDNSPDKIAQIEHWINGIRDRKKWNSLPKFQSAEWIPSINPKITSLTVVPDGALCQIPLEIFRNSAEDLLLQSTAISYLPSFASFRENQTKSNQSTWKGFAPAYSNFELPGNQQEVSLVKDLTGGMAFLDKAASKENFLEQAPTAGLIHLAVHGELDPNSPNFSRLWFGDREEDALTALEITEVNLDAHLAVLSACNSGVGDLEFGNGLLSLAQAFRTAGATSTLMSLWEVPDRETRDLMEGFYVYLQKGWTKDQALRQAKLDYLENVKDPALLAPFFWAGFVVLGDVDPLNHGSPTWIWLGLILLAIGVFFIWKKSGP